MNPTDIDQSIINQETLRLQIATEQQLNADNQAFQYATLISYDTNLGLWNLQIGASTVKAIALTNAAIALGETVHYYKAPGQNYGYIKTMPRA